MQGTSIAGGGFEHERLASGSALADIEEILGGLYFWEIDHSDHSATASFEDVFIVFQTMFDESKKHQKTH